MTIKLYTLQIDWEGTGAFLHNEAEYVTYYFVDRGNDHYLNFSGNGFEPNQISTVRFTLKDPSDRFDPFNTSSPLYGLVEGGKEMKFWLRNGAGGTVYDLFTGVIEDPEYNKFTHTMSLVCQGGWDALNNLNVSTAVVEDTDADTAIAALLSAVSWDHGSEIDAGPDVIPFWWGTGSSVKSQIEALTQSGMGYAFMAADGKFKYYNRYTTDAAVVTLTEDKCHKDIGLSMPYALQRNQIEITVNPVTKAGSATVIWTLGDTPTIEVGSSKVFRAKHAVAADIQTPVATTDYQMFRYLDPNTDDVTADFSVTIDAKAMYTDITVTNNGAVAGKVDLLQLKGYLLEMGDQADAVEQTGDYATRPRIFQFDSPWIQDWVNTESLAEFLSLFLENPLPVLTVKIANRAEVQFLDLYDRVSVDFETYGIEDDFLVLKIQHEASGNLQEVVTTMKLIPSYDVTEVEYWTLDESLLGVGTHLAW